MIHRVGRTARMGRRGWAMTMLSPEDHLRWRRLRRQGAPDLPELDVEHLVEEGGWRYVGGEAAEPSAPPAAEAHDGHAMRSRRRRTRGRGGRGRSMPPAAATA